MVDNFYKGKRVLITGGLGFIGSNLAIKLVEQGAEVTIVDAMIGNGSGYGVGGANRFNISTIEDKVKVNLSNVCDPSMRHLVAGQDYIFHLAAQMSHTLGMKDSNPDIDYNIKGTANLLRCCVDVNPSARIIYTGSRGQYGHVDRLPVREDHPMYPLGSHEISKQAAEGYLFSYHRSHGLRTTATRLSNIYGPRAQMQSPEFGVINWFIRLALDKKPIPIMGNGLIKRDCLYIDDCVNALLLLGEKEEAVGRIYNIGDSNPTNFKTIAEVIAKKTGAEIQYTEFSEDRKRIEPGDFYPDVSKLRHLGWTIKTDLHKGLGKTIRFYQKNKERYW